MEVLLWLLACIVLPMMLANRIAKSKGRQSSSVFMLLGWLGVIILLCLKPDYVALREESAEVRTGGGKEEGRYGRVITVAGCDRKASRAGLEACFFYNRPQPRTATPRALVVVVAVLLLGGVVGLSVYHRSQPTSLPATPRALAYASAAEFLVAHGLNPETVFKGASLAGVKDAVNHMDGLNAALNKARLTNPDKARELEAVFIKESASLAKTYVTFESLTEEQKAKVIVKINCPTCPDDKAPAATPQ